MPAPHLLLGLTAALTGSAFIRAQPRAAASARGGGVHMASTTDSKVAGLVQMLEASGAWRPGSWA